MIFWRKYSVWTWNFQRTITDFYVLLHFILQGVGLVCIPIHSLISYQNDPFSFTFIANARTSVVAHILSLFKFFGIVVFSLILVARSAGKILHFNLETLTYLDLWIGSGALIRAETLCKGPPSLLVGWSAAFLLILLFFVFIVIIEALIIVWHLTNWWENISFFQIKTTWLYGKIWSIQFVGFVYNAATLLDRAHR